MKSERIRRALASNGSIDEDVITADTSCVCAPIISDAAALSPRIAMANTSVNHEAERWIVAHALPEHFRGHQFKPRKLKLSWGGSFAFDAVSEDHSIVVSVSTSAARTATGKSAVAKYQKLKSDALYLLHIADACRKVMVFTEPCMQQYFLAAAKVGRFPPSVELVYMPLPAELQARVLATRERASRETSPAYFER